MADMLIITAAVIGALLVIFCGVAVIVMEAAKFVVRIWWNLSACGKNVRMYLYNRRDFLAWKQVLHVGSRINGAGG